MISKEVLAQQDAPSAQIDDISVPLSDAYERGLIDINFFAALCMPTICIFALPAFYVAVWQILTARDSTNVGKLLRFALGLPRGHAKTTFLKIIISWLIVYDKASFILIICANSDLADAILADIYDILTSPNIIAIYGDFEGGLAINASDVKKGTYHSRSVTLAARGWKAGIRGLNLKNERPDVIFCDDVQTKDNDNSPAERDHLLTELVGTIFKALRPTGDRLIIYVGNMYSEECILNKFHKNSKWISMVTGAILSSGVPLWPELFSLEELMESYEHDESLGFAHVWFAEVMNDPKNIALSILPHPLPDCPEELIEDPDGVFLTIDPAGFRNASDDNVIAVHYKYNNKGYVVETSLGIMDPGKLIQEAFRLATLHGASLIGIEDTGYQQTLLFWVNFFLKEYNITGIAVVPLQPHRRSKETRIRQFIAELYAETYYISDPATRRLYVWQASVYKIGHPKNRDDLLDAIAYGQDVRNEYWHLITNNKRRIYDHTDAKVLSHNTPF